MTRIGPDFGDRWTKWISGAMTANGIIYCPPTDDDRGILKIDTNTDNVTELDANLLPDCVPQCVWIQVDKEIESVVDILFIR